jgi:hypothetical protein
MPKAAVQQYRRLKSVGPLLQFPAKIGDRKGVNVSDEPVYGRRLA